MKNILVSLAVIIGVACSAHAQSFYHAIPKDNVDVTVSSHPPTLVSGINKARMWYTVKNIGLYDIRISSYAEPSTKRGRLLKPGEWFESIPYIIDISSIWAVSAGTGTASTANFFEYSQ